MNPARYTAMMVLLMVPALMALAHDLYINIYIDDLKYGFRMSDYGYIFKRYDALGYVAFMSSVPPDYKVLVDWLLNQKAIIVGVLYGVIMPFLLALQLFVLRLFFGGGRLDYGGYQAPDRDALLGRRHERIKYKRR